jgi:RNA recognition motif-containing protein
LINKIWNSVAIAFLNKDPKSSLLVKLTKPHPTLEEFYFAMKNAPKFPISFFHFDVQTLVNWPDLKKFFKEFGLNIRVLVLKVASGKEVNEMKKRQTH